jgi:hypothetical protein
MERLRYLARGGGAGCATIASEAALALGGLCDLDAGAVVTAARRLLDHHPACGPLWWVCAHVLAAEDPYLAAGFAAAELDADATDRRLAELLDERLVRVLAVLARPGEQVVPALARSCPPSVRAVGDRWSVRRLVSSIGEAVSGDVTGYGPDEAADAVRGADLVVLDTLAAGPDAVLVPVGGAGLVAAASRAGVPVVAAGGLGKLLPGPVFSHAVERVEAAAAGAGDEVQVTHGGRYGAWDEPGLREGEVVPAGCLAGVIGPDGPVDLASQAAAACPVPAELLRRAR